MEAQTLSVELRGQSAVACETGGGSAGLDLGIEFDFFNKGAFDDGLGMSQSFNLFAYSLGLGAGKDGALGYGRQCGFVQQAVDGYAIRRFWTVEGDLFHSGQNAARGFRGTRENLNTHLNAPYCVNGVSGYPCPNRGVFVQPATFWCVLEGVLAYTPPALGVELKSGFLGKRQDAFKRALLRFFVEGYPLPQLGRVRSSCGVLVRSGGIVGAGRGPGLR